MSESTVTTPALPDTATPVTSEMPPDSSGEVVDSVDWAGVSSEEEDFGDTPTEALGEEPAAPAEPIVQTPAVAPIAPVVAPEVVATVAPPVAPVVPPVTPAVESPAAPIDYAAEEAKILGELEKAYSMSEEDALAFQTEPELVLPKLAAKLHHDIAKDVMAGLQSVMPMMMQQMTAQTEAEAKARTSFYEANPDLNDPKLEQYVIQCGKLFRSVNRDAPADQAIVLIGNMVRQALGMPAPITNSEVNAVPAAATSAPQTAPRVVPFSPSRGAGGAVKPAAQPLSPWEELAVEDD